VLLKINLAEQEPVRIDIGFEENMNSTAKAKYLRSAPRKVQVVLDLIRGKKVEEALITLKFCDRLASEYIEKVLRSAIANANQGEKRLEMEKARVVFCSANQGPVMRNAKRFMARAQGRAGKIRKLTTHLIITVSDEAVLKKATKRSLKKEA
jgi:large subunit ribosomal protein L22